MSVEIASRRVDWDDEKAATNVKKHGIKFEDAARIFLDDRRLDYYDEKHSEEEDRYITIGMVNAVLFVVYTERGATTRLISARRATKREKERYYGQYTDL